MQFDHQFPMNKTNYLNLLPEDFARHFGCPGPLHTVCSSFVVEGDFRHQILAGRDRENFLLKAVQQLELPLEDVGVHRFDKWVRGWQETLDEFRKSSYAVDALQPKFVRPNLPFRFEGEYIQPLSPRFYFDYMQVLISWIFLTYFSDMKFVCEFGCGTGLNLVFGARVQPRCHLYGTDWAPVSQILIEEIRSNLIINVQGRRFDLFNPDNKFILPSHCGILTVGALEQLGSKFEPFLNYLRRQRPSICVHLEPINELLNENELFDWVAIKYSEKRKYLSGFLTYLRTMEMDSEIEIIKSSRVFGSAFNDGHSMVVWRFLN